MAGCAPMPDLILCALSPAREPNDVSQSLKESVRHQREMLTDLLGGTMRGLANDCAQRMGQRGALEQRLQQAMAEMSYCKYLYVLDRKGVQVTANVTRDGLDQSQFGRDRSARPYMQGIVGSTDFKLSEAYISRNKKRPSVTAVQVIRNDAGRRIGFLGADYDLRELPNPGGIYQEPADWRQIKGDPAIRGGLFLQERVESLMDSRLEEVMPLMVELMSEHGVFHGKFHFSSSRATIWLVDDPYSYRILDIDALTDPDICLAYPRRAYFERAIVPAERIADIFEGFRQLRFADENIYLRSGSLNIVNGMVALNFSCDGSHYMRFDEFLSKDSDFWFGKVVA